MARTYLSNHFDGIYYNDPANKFEHEASEEKLNRLQEKQIEMLNVLFSENKDVLNNLSSDLLCKRSMGRDELTAHLSKVVLAHNFPLPLGYFKDFGGDWPQDCGLNVGTG